MRASKGFWTWIGVAVFVALAIVFVANYGAIKAGGNAIVDDVHSSISQILPDQDENENQENNENTEE